MNKPKFGYGWLIKWILAAILIAAGILIKIYDVEVVYASTGIAIVLFSLLRVVPLMKTLKKEVLRTLNLIEIIFDTIMGGLMIWVVFSGLSTTQPWNTLYGYLLSVFFYVRGFIYFVSMYFFGEKTEAPKFWFHLVALSIGSFLLGLTLMGSADDIIATLGWVVLFIAVAGGGYLGYDGYGGFRKYREQAKALNEEKRKQTETQPIVDKPIEQPKVEEPKEKEVPIS